MVLYSRFGLCFGMHYFVPFLVLQSSWRGRELVALLLLSYGCLVTVNVLWLFLAGPWVGLQCVIVVFPNHTHLHFTGQKRLKKHCSKHFPRPCGKKRAQITRDSFSLVEAFALNLKKVWLSLITRLDFDPPCNFFCHLQIFIPTLLFPIFQRIFSNWRNENAESFDFLFST